MEKIFFLLRVAVVVVVVLTIFLIACHKTKREPALPAMDIKPGMNDFFMCREKDPY